MSVLNKIPKVELHVHLDCSLSFDVVEKIQPGITEERFRTSFIAPQKCIDLADFLRCTPSGIQLMQTRSALKFVVEDLLDQLKRENVVYAEIRFAPLQHLSGGLRPEEVVEIVSDTTAGCSEKTGIRAGIILCTLRHFNEYQSLQTIKLVDGNIVNTPVVGFDIAGDEAGFSLDAHKEAFSYAHRRDIPITAHAGEASGYESVLETIEKLQPTRIGHGVRSIEHPELVEYLAENNIHLEVCPTCNIQTDVFNQMQDHPIDMLYRSGVSLGVNTDARTLVNTTLTKEYEMLNKVFDWQLQDFKRCNMMAISHAFASDSEKAKVRNIIEAGYAET